MPAGKGLGQSHLPNSLQHPLKFRRRRKTHGSIRVQEGEPTCRGTKPAIARQIFTVDARGYPVELWKEIAPPK